MLSLGDPPQIERITQTLSKRWEKIFHANGKEEKAEEVICIFDKIDFKTNAKVTDKEGHYVMIR